MWAIRQKTNIMQNRALRFILQLMGFAFAGAIFFILLLGNKANSTDLNAEEPKVYKAGIGLEAPKSVYSNSVSSSDYSGPSYEKPSYPDINAPETAAAFRSEKPEDIVEVNRVNVVRSWKGVHRDLPFATLANDRFKQQVLKLSDEYGLYPDVFMSRIIAYSYEYVLSPERDPMDKNFTGMKRPNADERARFRSVEESLKAYAVVNAGEITRLSPAGAIAKHERSWTMQKIIETNNFVAELAMKLRSESSYEGMVGKINKVSAAENEKREVIGETLKMVSQVENEVKTKKAQAAGFDNWEDFVDDMTEEEIEKQEKVASKEIAAVSKKKSLHLKRRVAAKN